MFALFASQNTALCCAAGKITIDSESTPHPVRAVFSSMLADFVCSLLLLLLLLFAIAVDKSAGNASFQKKMTPSPI